MANVHLYSLLGTDEVNQGACRDALLPKAGAVHCGARVKKRSVGKGERGTGPEAAAAAAACSRHGWDAGVGGWLWQRGQDV